MLIMQKNHQIIIFSVLMTLCGCFGCDKNDCKSDNLQFEIPVQAYGLKDTLQLGDTIRIKFEMPDQLTERNSGVSYKFVNYEFYLINYIEKIDSLPLDVFATSNFIWTPLQGAIEYDYGAYLMGPAYRDGIYYYEVEIIVKKKGLFALGMNSTAWHRKPLAKVEGPCSDLPMYVYPRLINVDAKDTNFEFLQHSPEPTYVNMNRQRFDDAAGFCFYVK
jgi:hypothetical protein